MPIDKHSPRDPHLAKPDPAANPAPQDAPRAAKAAIGATRRRAKKQVSFAETDVVATYNPLEGLAGHDLPIAQAAKPAAPAQAPASARPACAVLVEKDGSRSVLWPSGQRYHGAYDGFGAPHGEGTVRLADGHGHVSTWFHGTCTAVAGVAASARGVEPYLSPPSKRTATPPPTRNGAAAGKAKRDAGPAVLGATTGGRGDNLLRRLRKLGKKDGP